MLCEDVLERLSAFLDDEIDPLGSREIQQHLEACPSCTDALGRMKELAERLRAEAPYYSAPDSLRARVGQTAWSSASRGRAAGRHVGSVARGWLAGRRDRGGGCRRHMALHVPSAAGGYWLLREGSGVEPYTLTHGQPSDRRRLHDQHTVKPWFNGRLDFSHRSQTWRRPDTR